MSNDNDPVLEQPSRTNESQNPFAMPPPPSYAESQPTRYVVADESTVFSFQDSTANYGGTEVIIASEENASGNR